MGWKPIAKTTLNKLRNQINTIDSSCREDLHQTRLVSERDYVSRFLTHITYPHGPFAAKTSEWFCRTLPGNLEVKYGVDAIFIFRNEDDEKEGEKIYKVGMFEAKWPLDSNGLARGFDSSIRKSPPLSRYSSQLDRQTVLSGNVAIWSMFMNGCKEGTIAKTKKGRVTRPHYLVNGSTCILHDDAYDYKEKTRGVKRNDKWGIKDLDDMVSKKKTYSSGQVIEDILSCKIGKPLKNKGGFLEISDDFKVPIPVNIEGYIYDNNLVFKEALEYFMLRNGITDYVFVDVQNLDKLTD